MEIMCSLLDWKYGEESGRSALAAQGWGSTYFSDETRYKNVLWRNVDPKNRMSGYLLTAEGLRHVIIS